MRPQREQMLSQLDGAELDALVVGGGINGAVSAAGLSAQGLQVGIVDRADFASCTSQASSNLVWGGIKYLENREFSLVRQLCRSRNALLRHYPEAVREIRFVTAPTEAADHLLATLYAGTWLYWIMGSRVTQRPNHFDREEFAAHEPRFATASNSGGIEYSDAYLPDNDARFVFNFIRQAMCDGALAANYLGATDAVHDGKQWRVQLQAEDGAKLSLRARVLINACGPFADAFNSTCELRTKTHHVFSKGVHLIVPRITPEDRVLAFFADDGRPFFVIPMGHRSCIGTTDTRVPTPDVSVSDADRDFILSNINANLALSAPLTRADIISERVGVRPLAVTGAPDSGDWFDLSRHHRIEIDENRNHLSIFGGKLTDCLNIGDEIIEHVRDLLPNCGVRNSWYGGTTPPPDCDLRLWRRYGPDALAISRDPELQQRVHPDHPVTHAELQHIIAHELPVYRDDILRRRTMLGLLFRPEELANISL
ncbi:MAG: glycerol-3-phosphate dehydrogenase [Rhodothermales bacterium]|jgi:glycerol-3-phosphate dehydrogenase